MTLEPPEPNPERKRDVPTVLWFILGVLGIALFIGFVILMRP